MNANSKAPLVCWKLQISNLNKQASKMKLTFNQILISRNKVMLSSNNMVVTCTTIENKKVIISDAKLQVIFWQYILLLS